MEYTEKQIDEIILKSYFQGVFETIEVEDYMVTVNKVTIDNNWNGHIRVFMHIYLEHFNNTIIDRIDSVLNMFETPDNEYDNRVSFYSKEENIIRVAFSTTRACIQRLIDRSNKIEFKEEK